MGCLGYGDTEGRGDDPNEMGDYLDTIELPTGFTPIKLVAGGYFNCVLNQSILCWGGYVFILSLCTCYYHDYHYGSYTL